MQNKISDFLISIVLAHSVVFETKQKHSPNNIVDDVINESDENAPSGTATTADIYTALSTYLPDLFSTLTSQVGSTEKSLLDASKSVSPGYNKLASDLYSKYAPGLAKTGAEVENINRTGAAATDLDILNNYGVPLSEAALASGKALNPEWYKSRTTSSNALNDLLGSININDPNIEAERLINQENIRSGNTTTPSGTNTVANALSFGNERIKRQNQLSEAIKTASGLLPTLQSNFNPAANATTRASTDAGLDQFVGVKNTGDKTFDFGGDVTSNIFGSKNASIGADAENETTWDKALSHMDPC